MEQQQDTESLLAKARQQLEDGQNEQARLLLLELLQQEPRHSAALLMLGGAYYYEKKFAEAEMIYQRLTQMEPGSGLMSIALFNCLWRQGRHEEAAGEIRRFIAVADPQQERSTLQQYAQISQKIAAGLYQGPQDSQD